ncbi:MAG TPA: hypothetical protein PK776_05340 [Flavobacterium sp.]|jgi:hypothetical protein|nr:hypothetical protein [Flavobacterium sp.]
MSNIVEKSSWIELTNEELMTINGGIRVPGPYGWIVSGLIWAIDEWDDIKAGFKRGYDDAQK